MQQNRRTKQLLMLTILLWCSELPQSLNATLIIAIRQNDALYVASDSLLSHAGEKTSQKYMKCFPAWQTGCVAISGFSGADGDITTTSNRITFDLRFPQQLDRIATQEFDKHQVFHDSATNILDRFEPVYKSFMKLVETNSVTNHERFDETDIYFFGYDPADATFCHSTARFTPVAPYTFTLEKASIPESTISFEGEYGFLTALMRGNDPRIKPLKPKALVAGLSPPSFSE